MAVSRVVFHLTDRCQRDCRHCLRDPGRAPADLPLALVEDGVDQAVALHRVSHVGLTGGEPTLHPDLEGVVDAAVRRGLTWHLVSRGALRSAGGAARGVAGSASARRSPRWTCRWTAHAPEHGKAPRGS